MIEALGSDRICGGGTAFSQVSYTYRVVSKLNDSFFEKNPDLVVSRAEIVPKLIGNYTLDAANGLARITVINARDFSGPTSTGGGVVSGTFKFNGSAIVRLNTLVSLNVSCVDTKILATDIEYCPNSLQQTVVNGFAFADPIITVDPDWEYSAFADDVTITEFLAPVESISNALPVPLPPAGALLASLVLGFPLAAKWRQHSKKLSPGTQDPTG